MIDLSGIWQLSDAEGGYRLPMAMPGDGISALHRHGQIADPYWGRNEYDLRWICQTDWTATRTVNLSRTDYDLVLSMVDTIAEVRVNGTLVHQSDSMFRSYRIDLTRALKIGENDIAVTFRSVAKEADARQARQPYFVPFVAANTPIPNGNMVRKSQCDFGWDWNIALASFGIYGDLYLAPRQKARIANLLISQNHDADAATVSVTCRIDGEAEGQHLTISFCGQDHTAQIDKGSATARIVVQNPELWWPNGLGPQPLFDLVVTLGDETTTRRIGLRDLKLVSERDAIGRSFLFRVNGKDVFAKGANWIPADALGGRINREEVRDLLQSAVDAHMNMIRIWGGGRYEPDWFYDLCDEMGLMVWQDFMFACHIYPADNDFLSDVAKEVTEQALRLHSHASLAVWCGDNELIGALTWYEETRKNRDRYLVGYDRLNRTIEQALIAAVPHATWWPSSPSPGPMDFGDAWHDDSKGDMHFWSVWHEGRNFDHYRDVSPRFCSEFGFQSYPSMDVIRRFADPSDFNIAAPVMESHQKNAGGNARIAETMFRYFRFPVDFENFVYLSQIQQGLAIKTAVTHWRSLKPVCMGTLYWQLNDTWPVCSWASLDHGGGWKLMHHMAKAFYAPIHVTAVPVAERIELRGVNDTHHPVTLRLVCKAAAMTGETRDLSECTIELGPDAAKVILTIEKPDLRPDEILTFVWFAGDKQMGGDIFAPKPYKDYDLRPAEINLGVERSNDQTTLTLTSGNLALFVAIECDQPGRFSQNAFTLFPGHPATIHFTPTHPNASTPSFTVRDLHSATFGRN